MCENHIENRRKKSELSGSPKSWISRIPRFVGDQGPSKNMVLGSIGTLMGPNGVLRASPGRELRGKAAGGVGGAIGGPRYMKIGGDPGRIFRLFPKWPGMARNGLGGPWGYYLRVWGPPLLRGGPPDSGGAPLIPGYPELRRGLEYLGRVGWAKD